MPKIRTNRMAYKKFRVGGKGRLKRRQTNKSHLTAGRPAKRIRQLRPGVTVDKSNEKGVLKMLPYAGKGGR